MSYDLRIKTSAEKELKQIKSPILDKIDAALLNLMSEPKPKGSLKIQGKDNLFRIRCGNYRIVYAIYKSMNVIDILAIVHRKDAYKW